MSFYDSEDLQALGFRALGRNVKISRKASFHGISRIAIGDDSRIDDFCVLSAGEGGIEIGRSVHIAVMCSLIGDPIIKLDDFSGLSSRVSVYSSSEDHSGEAMINPTVPVDLTHVDHRPVWIGKHAIVGSVSVILPGSKLTDSVAVGALSLVNGTLDEVGIYAGVPAKFVAPRS